MGYEDDLYGKPLSARQKQVCAMVSCGRSNKEIATEMGVTAGTIKQYMVDIFRKTGVRSRLELFKWWNDKNTVQPLPGDCINCVIRQLHLARVQEL